MDQKLATVCRPPAAPGPVEVAQALASAAGGGPEPLGAACVLARPRAPGDAPAPGPRQWPTEESLEEFRRHWEKNWSTELTSYGVITLRPNATRPENNPPPNDPLSAERLRQFKDDPQKNQAYQVSANKAFLYYGAIRATHSCLACHRQIDPTLQPDGLIAVIRVEVPTNEMEKGIDINRAVLISTALVTALLIMGGSYVIVRYVIVKPVKHLKEVSDAISAGLLNVRSEIQTGDEFEDLSHAFNRMLRNLVNMQDRLRKVNSDLDRKVDELAQANLALYESNRLKSDFLATMSHELRTPLNSILGFSEVLQSAGGLSDKQARWLTNVRTSGEQLLALINDILDLARIEAGKMQVRLTEFSSYDVCGRPS